MQVLGGVGHPHDFRFESGGQDGESFLGVPFFILPVASALSLTPVPHHDDNFGPATEAARRLIETRWWAELRKE